MVWKKFCMQILKNWTIYLLLSMRLIEMVRLRLSQKKFRDRVTYQFAVDLKMTILYKMSWNHDSINASLHQCLTVREQRIRRACHTLDSIAENHENWTNECWKKTSLKYYCNCFNRPLLKSCELSTPPYTALHIRLGINCQ